MSDTDDTDVLLLIPPDFFLIPSDSEESYDELNRKWCDPHCSAVDTLITQVHRLENRLNKIEINSENSSRFSSLSNTSTVIAFSEMSDDLYRNQDLYSSDYIPTSAKSTPQKPKNKLVPGIASLPSTPSFRHRKPLFRSKINRRNPSEGTGDGIDINNSRKPQNNREILSEIDKFLSSVKTIKSVTSSSCNLEEKPAATVSDAVPEKMASPIKFDNPAITISELSTLEESSKRFSNLNLNDVNRLLEAIETQQQQLNLDNHKVEELYENESFTTKNSFTQKKNDDSSSDLTGITTESSLQTKKAWKCGDTISSVPNLGHGMRETMYKTHQSADDILMKQKSKNNKLEMINQKRCDSLSDSEISEPTVLEARKYSSSVSAPRETNNSFNQKSSNSLCKNISFNESTKESDGMQSLPSNLSTFTLQQFSRDSLPPNINLFSLTDIWNTKTGQDSLISDNDVRKLWPKLEEEKCRRKHCEKLISELQMKILEMQQRLAVAIQLDSAKDEAILRFHEAWEKVATRWKSLEKERNSLSNKILAIEEKSNCELAEANQKIVQFEVEISKALDLAHSNKEKCTNLEKDREDLLKKMKHVVIQLKSSQENVIDINKQKDDIYKKISQLEKESLKDKKLLLESQEQLSRTKNSVLSSQTELSLLKNENNKLQIKIKDSQTTIFELETQRNNLNISIEALQKNEETLQREMKTFQEEAERVKTDLRNFYQQQVEVLVKDKLKEFQQQLEQAEKALQDELRIKEQSIAKQAAKQMHKLTEKHRLEIHLIEEKHKEQNRLHELQNNQLRQQMSVLQNKLDSYHARQSNIAQELHNVMEAQWIEALRIINNTKTPLADSFDEKSQKESKTELGGIEEINKILTAKENLTSNEGPKFNFRDQPNPIKFKSRHSDHIPITTNPSIDMFETPVSTKVQFRKDGQPHLNETELQKYIRQLLDNLPKGSENPGKQEKPEFESQESSSSDLTSMPSTWQQGAIGKDLDRSNIRDRSGKPPWK